MAYKDMREFLAVLKEDGQLKDVDVSINVEPGKNELQSLMRHLAETKSAEAEVPHVAARPTAELTAVAVAHGEFLRLFKFCDPSDCCHLVIPLRPAS